MKIVMLGAPGAGKGTQAKKIAEKYHADFLTLQDMIILKAEKAGYEHPYGIAAPSDPIMQVHYVVREAAALIKAKIYGNI